VKWQVNEQSVELLFALSRGAEQNRYRQGFLQALVFRFLFALLRGADQNMPKVDGKTMSELFPFALSRRAEQNQSTLRWRTSPFCGFYSLSCEGRNRTSRRLRRSPLTTCWGFYSLSYEGRNRTPLATASVHASCFHSLSCEERNRTSRVADPVPRRDQVSIRSLARGGTEHATSTGTHAQVTLFLFALSRGAEQNITDTAQVTGMFLFAPLRRTEKNRRCPRPPCPRSTGSHSLARNGIEQNLLTKLK